MKYLGILGTLFIFIIGIIMIFGMKTPQFPLSGDEKQNIPSDKGVRGFENAYFAGGCFWCLEGVFEAQDGVKESRVGYIGGTPDTANYTAVSSGETKHREAIKVIYDSNKIDYKTLVELFWTQIDPTDPDGQFADKGFHYTTAVYHNSIEEKNIALESKNNLEQSGKFDTPIVTKILPYSEFFEAESYHQDYYKKSALRYKFYYKGSGRADFIDANWKDRIAELNEQTYSEQSLRERLTLLQYKVTQQNGTEPAFNNKYWDNKQDGIYVDIVDGTPLYSSLDKYDSGTGWPSFSKPIQDNAITEKSDYKLIVKRIEARSTTSDAHLGHIFNDGPKSEGGMRHCINSAALRFVPLDKLQEEGYEEYIELFE